VLGGYGDVHEIDARTSCEMIDGFMKQMGHERALDCGAGIGRVTKHVLEQRFDKIDLLDPSPILLEKAKILVDSNKAEK